MEDNLGKDEQEKSIENIADQDWPLLRELESTRFALKNKKGSNQGRQSLQAVKEASDKEDKMIAQQNLEDEKLVDAFLSVKPTNNDSVKSSQPKEELFSVIEEIRQDLNESANSLTMPEKAPETVKAPTPVVNNKPSEAVVLPPLAKEVKEPVKAKKGEAKEFSRLIALGMAKIYVNKTDDILDPLRFILTNFKQIAVALIQFLIPALITWYLTTHTKMISSELAKEPTHIHVLYVVIFYFACLFLWISGQVVFGGMMNLAKQAMANLAKEGKS